MKKTFKLLAVVAVVAGILLAISSTALHILLPPQKAKAMVLKQLTGHLKREVQLGDVSVGVLTGLAISDLKVSEAPNFSQGTFISSDHFSIRLALLPLLFRRVEVKQVVLDHPVINVVRNPDGKTFNFSDLLAPAAALPAPAKTVPGGKHAGLFALPEAYAAPFPAASTKDAEPPFSLVVSHAQIQNGVLHFLDRSPARQSVDIDPLNLKLKNVSLTSPFTVQAFLKAKARNVVATLKLAGEADLATGSFKVKDCELSSGGSTLTLEGKASQLKSNRPSVDLHLDVKEFKLSTLAPFMPLPAALTLDGPMLGHARIKGDQNKMNFSMQLDLEKVAVHYAKQFSKPARIPMGMSLQGDLAGLQDVDITDLKGTLGSLQLKGHGKIFAVNSAQPQINMHIESNSFPASELMDYASASLPQGLTVKGHAQFAADVSGTEMSSRIAAKLEGKELEIVQGDSFKKLVGTALRLSLVGEKVKQTMTFQNLNAVLGSLELNGTGSVQAAAQPPKFQLALKSNSFSLQEIAKLSPLAAAYHLSGTAVADVRASGSADAPVANGTVSLQNASLQYQQSILDHLAASLSFTQQDVSIPKLSGKLNGSDITLKLTGHKLTTKPDVNVEATITELDLDKLLPPPATASTAFFPTLAWVSEAWAAGPPAAVPPLKTSGHLTVGHIKHELYNAKNLDFNWALTDVTPDLSRVSGTAVLKQGAGVLKNIEKLAAMSKSARVALLPIETLQKLDKSGLLSKMGLPSLQTISFNTIHGDYALRSGMMDVKTFEITGQQLNVNALGSIGLAGTQPLDMRVTMKLAPGSIGGTLGQLVTDESGRPTLAFTAKGTVSNPDVKPDLQDVGRKAVQQLGQELFKALGKSQQQAPPSNNAGDAVPPAQGQPSQPPPAQPNPAEELQKALKGIFH